MEKARSQEDTEQISRQMEHEFQQDRLMRSSIDGNEIIRQHGEMKEKLIKISEILNSSSLSDRNKVEESLQVIKESSKDMVSNTEEVIDVLRRSVQGQHIEPETLHEKIGAVLRRMEELQNESNQLRAGNIFMAQENKSMRETIQSLQTIIGQHKHYAQSLRNSLSEYQFELEKKMSASERQETSQENKTNADVEKLKADYEEALNKQKLINKANAERYQALLKAKSTRCQQLEEASSLLSKQNTKFVEEFRVKEQQLIKEKKRLEDINTKLEALEKENKKIKDMLEQSNVESTQLKELQLKINDLKKNIAKQNEEIAKQRSLKQEILKENSALKEEMRVKKDQVFSLGLRHRDEINNQKETITQLAKKYQQTQTEIDRLKAASQPNELSELLPLIEKFVKSASKQQKLMKKKQISQAILFM